MTDKQVAIFDFARQNNLCTISTTVENTPESAIVDFYISENLEIIFNSYAASRKYTNLLINPKVSVVIGFGEMLKTLQCEGTAIKLEGHEAASIISEVANSLLFSRRWKNVEMKYFKIKLNWARLSDFSNYPPTQIELNFEDLLIK